MYALQCTKFLDIKYHDAEKVLMSIESVAVSTVMVKNVKTVKENQIVKQAARIMSDNEIGSVVIVKNEDSTKPVGIITEKDIVRVAGAEQALTLQMPAREIMSKPIITIDTTSSIKDALQTMELNNIRRLPVLDRNKNMIGIVTDKDIFRALMKDQSLVASFCESLVVDYRPAYERFSEFMLGEVPSGSSHR
jgi:CBS domain-containing protein